MDDETMAELHKLMDQINSGEGGVMVLNIGHEDDCPTLKGGSSLDCTCGDVEVKVTDVTDLPADDVKEVLAGREPHTRH